MERKIQDLLDCPLLPRLKSIPWSKAEDQLLEQLVRNHLGLSNKQLLTHFPKRTLRSIDARIKHLNLQFQPHPNPMFWAEKEDQLLEQLVQNHPEWSYDQITSQFQKQTTSSVKKTKNAENYYVFFFEQKNGSAIFQQQKTCVGLRLKPNY
eukprot:TRINITY_DN24662_c0_g1_i1.p5 TRINITY_DN24662_c0_g1~~TRINITY_DN24662_c0_g1_i1.p5  ORF type:complete len:151 (+),score=7.53 TRINITY_DN24662_c0_g1_i1:1171-1623(+)